MGTVMPHTNKFSSDESLHREISDLRCEIRGLRREISGLLNPRGYVPMQIKSQIKVNNEIDISLIIPTRERMDKLETCLFSFFNRAGRRERVEAILVTDHCDTSMRDIGNFITQHRINAKNVQVWRSENSMINDYNNYGAQCSSGNYIWILNDDCEMVTDNWDYIISEKIENFCSINGDRCCYVIIDDSTHSRQNLSETHGCCFPILTRESVVAMNGIMPKEICYWGADFALNNIFRALPQDRILNLVNDVKILHHCRHNSNDKSIADIVSKRIEHLCVTLNKNGLNGHQQTIYVEALKAILKQSP